MADVEGEGHVCKECGKSYNKKWRLEEHKRSHTGERPYKCSFEGCGKSFIRPYHLRRHLLIHTGQSFKCTYPGCTQTFSLKHSVKRHEKRSHNNPFQCQYEGCHQSFKKSSQLSRHICLIHTKESRFKCQVEGCDAGFNYLSRLTRHMKKHNKGYICSSPGCSEAFDKFSKLTAHTRNHGYVCEHCDKIFPQVWELKRHSAIHNTNRKMYECPREGCSKVYTKAYNLKMHIKAIHEGNRPYLCTWEGCGKGFVHKVSLRQHLVLHSQRRIRPAPSPQEKQRKKKKKRPSLAKQLSGYRSSLSESSDTHFTETAPQKRKTPNQPQRSETETVMDTREMTAVQTRDGETRQSDSRASEGVSESTNLMTSSKDSGATTADQGRSGEMQDVATAASSTLVTCNKSATASENHGRPEKMQVGVASTSFSTMAFPCGNSAADFVNQVRPEETQGGVASAALLTLGTSSNNSATSTAYIDRTDEMQDEIASSNFQEQNASAFTDDKMFSSSDEDGEGMDWVPTVAENLEVESPVECDLESENEFENIRSNVGGSEDRCMIEDGPRDRCYSSEPPENSSTVLTKKIDAEMVPDSDSSEDDLPLSLLCKASSSVNKTNMSVKRNKKTQKKQRSGIKKSRDSSQSDRQNVQDSVSKSQELVPVPSPVVLKTFCNSGDIREGVSALESTDFPGMDDVLQVIIEEEESELVNDQSGTRFENEEVNVEEGYADNYSPGDGSEGRNAKLISSEKQVRRSPMKDLNLEEMCEDEDNLRLACESHGKTNNNDGELLNEENALVVDSFNDVTNNYENISTDEESGGVSEQQKAALDSRSPKTRDTRDKGIDKQGCLKGSTRDTRIVYKSRGLARGQGGSESKETRDGNGNMEERVLPDLRSEVSHAEHLSSSMEVTNNRETKDRKQETLTQSTCKTLRQKNKKTVSAKRPVDKGSSCTPTKPAVPSTAKSRGKNALRVNRVNGDNLEANDVATEAETIEKPVKDEPSEDVSKAKFRNRSNIFACDMQTLELLWNFKGR
ncbi:hypothetical protein ACROYT_G018771 [Oculina patagonica]